MLTTLPAVAAALAFAAVAAAVRPADARAEHPPRPSAAAAKCEFHIYHGVDCTKKPYKHLQGKDLSSCCAACAADNQCQGFTLLQGVCALALGGGVGRWGIDPAATCGTRNPLPPASNASHGVNMQFDCGTRRLALSYATKLLGGQGQPQVFEALQLRHACGDSPPHRPPPPPPPPPPPVSGALIYWLSPSGNDGDSGRTPKAAWGSLQRVLQELEVLVPVSARPPVLVNLLPGTYRLNATLTLGSVHSGVTFQPAPGAEGLVNISGALDLSGLQWQPSPGHQAANTATTSSGSVRVWAARVPAGARPDRGAQQQRAVGRAGRTPKKE